MTLSQSINNLPLDPPPPLPLPQLLLPPPPPLLAFSHEMATPHLIEHPIVKIQGLVPRCWPYVDLELEKAVRESIS